jgi:hypothetical protein
MFISYSTNAKSQSAQIGEVAHVVLVALVQTVDGLAGREVDHARLLQVGVPTHPLLPIRELLQSALVPLGALALLLQRRNVLTIDHHLRPSSHLGVLGLTQELLVDVVLDVEQGSPGAMSVLVGGIGRVVGTGLKEGRDCVDQEEEQEDNVKAQVGLTGLLLLLGVGSSAVPV